jgi:dihydroorotate dehydrogenase subfamily 2
MIKIISKFSNLAYSKVIKPIMFLFPPDGVHKTLTVSGQSIGYVPPIRWLIKALWSYQNPKLLSQDINGVYYINPVGLSAGFDKDFKLIKVLPSLGFGFMELGSMTNMPSPGNPRPHYRRLKKSKSILVYAGLNNQGSVAIIKRLKNQKTPLIPLDISVAKTNSDKTITDSTGINDYINCLKKIKSANIGDQITINISCPNAFGGEPFTTPKRLENFLKEVDKLKLKQPLYLKMPSDLSWQEFKVLIDVILKHNIKGLKISNLAKDRKSKYLLDDLDDGIPGNMSGKPVFDLSNKLINQAYAYCGDRLIISGIGGVFSAKDAYEKIKHGASLIELVTGMIFEGPQLIGQINSGLAELLEKDGLTHISQAIGAYHKK